MWDSLIISPFVNVLLFIYNVIGQNFGIAIILFTLLIRLLTHPLMVQQIKGATAMQDLQKDKRYLDLQKKYKDDKQQLAVEQQKLWKEMGVNPFSSCLPTLIQFPIIIGLYQTIMLALASSPLELLKLTRHVYDGFLNIAMLLPLNSKFLWMDLGQPEGIPIPGLNIPFLPNGIPILAFIVLATTYLQSKLMTPASTNPGDQSAAMTKSMNLWMPFMMFYLALTFSSGLALYFVTSNVVGILQYALLGKVNFKNLFPSLGTSNTKKK